MAYLGKSIWNQAWFQPQSKQMWGRESQIPETNFLTCYQYKCARNR